MNRPQFLAINTLALALSALMLAHFFVARSAGRLSGEMTANQSKFNEARLAQSRLNEARQLETILDQLAKRIAHGSETDPRLRTILSKHGMQVTLEINGEKKQYP